jgi:hypothetical protein
MEKPVVTPFSLVNTECTSPEPSFTVNSYVMFPGSATDTRSLDNPSTSTRPDSVPRRSLPTRWLAGNCPESTPCSQVENGSSPAVHARLSNPGSETTARKLVRGLVQNRYTGTASSPPTGTIGSGDASPSRPKSTCHCLSATTLTWMDVLNASGGEPWHDRTTPISRTGS